MSGLDAIERLRERAAVLILTAYGTEDEIERALNAGAKGYLLKGAPLDDIERVGAESRAQAVAIAAERRLL